LNWTAQPKVGSLDNAAHKPGIRLSIDVYCYSNAHANTAVKRWPRYMSLHIVTYRYFILLESLKNFLIFDGLKKKVLTEASPVSTQFHRKRNFCQVRENDVFLAETFVIFVRFLFCKGNETTVLEF
jgi:hypothetical protein